MIVFVSTSISQVEEEQTNQSLINNLIKTQMQKIKEINAKYDKIASSKLQQQQQAQNPINLNLSLTSVVTQCQKENP